MLIGRGSAEGWDCLEPGTTPVIFFKKLNKYKIIDKRVLFILFVANKIIKV